MDQAPQSHFDWQVAGLFLLNLLLGFMLIGGSVVTALIGLLGVSIDGLIASENQLKIGEFYDVKIVKAEFHDLMGEVVS